MRRGRATGPLICDRMPSGRRRVTRRTSSRRHANRRGTATGLIAAQPADTGPWPLAPSEEVARRGLGVERVNIEALAKDRWVRQINRGSGSVQSICTSKRSSEKHADRFGGGCARHEKLSAVLSIVNLCRACQRAPKPRLPERQGCISSVSGPFSQQSNKLKSYSG